MSVSSARKAVSLLPRTWEEGMSVGDLAQTTWEEGDLLQSSRTSLERTCGIQHALDFANRLIDTSAGIVGGDGCYYPRDGYPRLGMEE